MEDLALFSKEQFTNYYIPTSNFTNGALIISYTFNRNNYNTDVYVDLIFNRASGKTGSVKPILYRGYFENGILFYDRFEYEIVTTSGTNVNIVLGYKSEQHRNYVNYRVQFECVGAISNLTINEIGLIFQETNVNKGLIGTTDRTISFVSSKRQDINQNFSTYQTYEKTHNFSSYTNRNNIDRIVNVVENPYILRDVKSSCIDNTTRELSLTNMNIDYVGSGTQYIKLSLKNIEEI